MLRGEANIRPHSRQQTVTVLTGDHHIHQVGDHAAKRSGLGVDAFDDALKLVVAERLDGDDRRVLRGRLRFGQIGRHLLGSFVAGRGPRGGNGQYPSDVGFIHLGAHDQPLHVQNHGQ